MEINNKDKKIIFDILDNLLYWETCPDDYKTKIRKLQKKYKE